MTIKGRPRRSRSSHLSPSSFGLPREHSKKLNANFSLLFLSFYRETRKYYPTGKRKKLLIPSFLFTFNQRKWFNEKIKFVSVNFSSGELKTRPTTNYFTNFLMNEAIKLLLTVHIVFVKNSRKSTKKRFDVPKFACFSSSSCLFVCWVQGSCEAKVELG